LILSSKLELETPTPLVEISQLSDIYAEMKIHGKLLESIGLAAFFKKPEAIPAFYLKSIRRSTSYCVSNFSGPFCQEMVFDLNSQT
jgi:hypothetical protein